MSSVPDNWEEVLDQTLALLDRCTKRVSIINNNGYKCIDLDVESWIIENGLEVIRVDDLKSTPNVIELDHKVICMIFDPNDADSDFHFRNANLAMLFKLTFGGQ